MMELIKSLRENESGAALVEYAVICGIVLVFVLAALATIGIDLNTIFTGVLTRVSSAAK